MRLGVPLAVFVGEAVVLPWIGVLLWRYVVVAGWRRWQVKEEQRRCDLAYAPTYCGRSLK
jgi:hypothetical protein